jgi:hypothetical protein
VTSDSDRGALTFLEHRTGDSLVLVGLAVPQLAAGSYSGKASLIAGDDSGDGDVSLTVKDGPFLFLFVLLASLVLAFLFQRATGVGVPRLKLNSKADGVRKTYDGALKTLKAVPGEGEWKKSRLTDQAIRLVLGLSDPGHADGPRHGRSRARQHRRANCPRSELPRLTGRLSDSDSAALDHSQGDNPYLAEGERSWRHPKGRPNPASGYLPAHDLTRARRQPEYSASLPPSTVLHAAVVRTERRARWALRARHRQLEGG